MPAEALLIDKAQLLTLTAPEMTVLVGGLRVLDTNAGGAKHGVFTKRPGALTNDFFVNLLDMGTEWKPASEDAETCSRGAIARRARSSGPARASIWSSARTRSCAPWPRSTAARTRRQKFVQDFVAAWTKVMNLDRFDAST